MTKPIFTDTAQTDTIWTTQTPLMIIVAHALQFDSVPCAGLSMNRTQVELFNNTEEDMLNFVGLEGFVEESKSSGADITCSYKKKRAAAALCQQQRTQWPLRPTFFCL